MLFADDTDIFCSGENLQQLLEMVTSEMSKSKNWFDLNKISLNFNQTKLMLFGNHKVNTQVKVMINNINIECIKTDKI